MTDQVTRNRAATVARAEQLVGASDDPIFAAIEHHRQTVKDYSQGLEEYHQLEEILSDKMSPAQERVCVLDGVMQDAAEKLVLTEPATVPGVIAALQHYIDEIDRFQGENVSFPDRVLPDGGDPEAARDSDSRRPEYFLIKNAVSALKRINEISGNEGEPPAA
jgi:hypothetical protein